MTNTRGKRVFDVVLAIEKDEQAHETLRLRTFFHQFPKHAPAKYYQLLRREIDVQSLYDAYPAEAGVADELCWHATLGPNGESENTVRLRIRKAIKNDTSWVLIGGPPCQALSLVGRSPPLQANASWARGCCLLSSRLSICT